MTRVNRRTFLRVAGVHLGAAAAADPLRPAPVMARRRAQPGPDVAVIGGGAFPNLDYRGFKVCPIGEGMDVNPDVEERIVSAYQVRRAREYLALRFPALKDMPVLESRVCQLENTADEHFLIDRHPDYDNVRIAGGGSGHGYKHGPVVGEYIAQRALGQDPHPELASVFRLR